MKFWDSSALLPLLVPEARSERLVALMREDAAAAVWWMHWSACMLSGVPSGLISTRLAPFSSASKGRLAAG